MAQISYRKNDTQVRRFHQQKGVYEWVPATLFEVFSEGSPHENIASTENEAVAIMIVGFLNGPAADFSQEIIEAFEESVIDRCSKNTNGILNRRQEAYADLHLDR